MRQVTALALMIMLVFAAVSCSGTPGGAEEAALEIRTELLEAEKLIIGADITADYGDRVYEFTVKYTGTADLGTIAVLAPETIAGITAEVTQGGCTLVYDGARLDMGALTTGGMSPADALPVLVAQWRGGFITVTGYEKLGETDTVVLITDIEDNTQQKTWFDARTHLPVRAELSDGGRLVIACVFNDVVIEK